MSETTQSREKEWFDVKMLAAAAALSVGTIRYHWRHAVEELNLPPTPAGWLDKERAKALLEYIRNAQESENERRHESALQWNKQRYRFCKNVNAVEST